VTLTLTPSSQS